MRDEHDDRIYQAFRHDLVTNVAAIGSSIAYAFERLHARLYAAPWSTKTGTKEKPCEQGIAVQ